MRERLLGCAAAAAALTIPATAHAGVILTRGTTFAISGGNDFQSELLALGLTQYTTTGAELVLDATSTITFEFLGSESGFDDTFSALGAPVLARSENTNLTNSFAAPVLIGTSIFGPGSLAGLLTFSSTNPNGAIATVGQDGFGIFLGPNQTDGPVTTFYLGYDDQITGQDDDHDDFIVRATVVTGAVPEPSTWATMLVGFGALGFALRRRRQAADGRVTFA